MDRKTLMMASKISNSGLRSDIMILRNNLKQLVQTSKRNTEIQQKIDEVGEAAVRCEDLETLAAKTTDTLRESFGLTVATYCLESGYRELLPPPMEHLPSPAADRLFFMEQERIDGMFAQMTPLLRGRLEHGSVHFFGIRELRRIRSEALIPLVYGDAVIGSLNLGSNDPVRYSEGNATDYLRRLAQVTALAMVNLRLRHAHGKASPALMEKN